MVHPEFYKTDIGWNDMYIGIVLLSFFIFTMLFIRHKLKYPILFGGFFLLLLSFQGGIKSLLYIHLPLLQLIRSNGEHRIYFILSIIILSGFALDLVLNSNDTIKFKKILLALVCIFCSLIIIGVLKNQNTFHIDRTSVITYFKELSIFNAIFIESIGALLLLILSWYFIKKRKLIFTIVTLDILINFWLCLPYGGVQLKSESEINKSLQQSVQSINKLPSNSPVNTVSLTFSKTEFVAEPVLFSNSIAFNNGSAYPSMFASYSNFLKSEDSKFISTKRGIYLKNSDTTVIRQVSISTNCIAFNVHAATNDTIVVLQNYSDNWSGFVDNTETEIQQFNQIFISVPVTKGEHFIKLEYFPISSVIAFWISLGGWGIIIISLTGLKRFV